MHTFIKKTFILLLLFVLCITVKANDGTFYASGNQLIPVVETDISVKKEILKIVHFKDNSEGYEKSYFEVTVYYEFFNPSAGKDLIVGFEASPPSNDDNLDRFPDHPYIYNFKTVMNGVELPYEVAHVPYQFDEDGDLILKKEKYYKDGHFQDLSLNECQNPPENEYYDYIGWFYYVYHFNAHFNPGLNIIQHTYRFDGANSVVTEYELNYVLTAANRWANNGIDDFTLEIDMGDRQTFGLYPTFFKNLKDWSYTGKGRANYDVLPPYYSADDEKIPVFHVQEGSIVFHKTKFHPEGELSLTKPSCYGAGDLPDPFSQMYLNLDSDCSSLAGDPEDLNDDRCRILKNLPFAYHGYIFKTKSLQKYFESTKWYVPNPEYKGTMDKLTPREQSWVTQWTK